MSNYEQESLSALMDGEADELELRRLLKTLDSDPELVKRWQRYHLAQSVLHDRGIPVSDRIAQGVAEALEHEPQPVSNSGLSRWQQQMTRIAIAACVAVVAVVALQPGSSNPDSPMVAEQSSSSAPQLTNTASENLLAEAPGTEVEPQVTEYFQQFFDAMRFDPEEPVRTEHLQDSPLYRLVNDYQTGADAQSDR